MFVWGRNNNHLFKQNYKKTYSLPQRLPVGKQIQRCAAGYDYILLLSNASLFCYYQSALYHLAHFQQAADIATTDNMIVVVATDGTATIAEFNPEKVMTGELTCNKIPLKEKIVRVFMNFGEVFLLDDSHQVHHLKRNEWYETKSYSDPQLVQGLGNKRIKTIAPAFSQNYFLTQDGRVYASSKKEPTNALISPFKEKFTEIAASEYFMGIAENGRLYVCGKCLDKCYDAPTEFGKISQKFIRISLSSENGFGITEKGEGWVWGKNANGELGISDYEPRTQPFPLVTLRTDTISEFILGEGYTVCLAHNPHAKKPKLNPNQELVSESVSPSIPHEARSHHFMISSIPSISIADPKKPSKAKSPKNASLLRAEPLRDNQHGHQRVDSHTPSKMQPRSKSPLDRSNSKSPVCKYAPPLEQGRQKSLSNCRQHKQGVRAFPSPSKADTSITAQVQFLQEQNAKLKKTLAQKEQVIEDITHKIRLLEDAIEEHERTLTNRDHLMEEYETREKEYLSHIAHLESTIDQLAKNNEQLLKNKTDRSAEHIEGIFQELKTEFNKEKNYYMTKMKEYEDLLNNQRSHYRTRIQQLQQEVDTFRSSENRYPNDALCDRTNKDNMRLSSQTALKSRLMEDNRQKMELIVSRIQDSKVRIGKSATKLNEFLAQE